jgi:protein tyrosine/serine phosphatase
MGLAPDDNAVRPPRRWTTRWWLVAGGVVLLVALGVLLTGHVLRARMLQRRFCVVEGGRLYRSSQLTFEQLAAVIKKHGIRTILNLRNPNETDYVEEAPAAQQHGVRLVSLPISSTEPMSDEQLAVLRQLYRDPANYPILVHCERGVARTGVAVALWRIEQQRWDPARAVEDMIASGYPIGYKNLDMRNLLLHWQRPPGGLEQDAQ